MKKITTMYARGIKVSTKSFLQKEAKEKGVDVSSVLDQMVIEEKRRRKKETKCLLP